MLHNIDRVLSKYGYLFVKGTVVTLEFSLIGVLGGVLLGLIITFMKRSQFKIFKVRLLSFIASVYVEVIRGTPILLQLYFFYFWVPDIVPFLHLNKFSSISLALVFNSAAYVSEIIRAGIEAVDKGQEEAARSLGLSKMMAMRKVILPQAMKNILPALCNEFIVMIKQTSLASTFFAGDIMTQYSIINGALFLVIEPLLIAGAIYFVLTFVLSKCVQVFERRLKIND